MTRTSHRKPLDLQVRSAFGEEGAAALLLDAKHRPVRALSLLSGAMDRLPIDEKKKVRGGRVGVAVGRDCHRLLTSPSTPQVEMDKSCILLGDACEVCERIFSSPVPLVYTRHTARFLSAWLLLLPLGLYESFAGSWNHLALLPAATLVSIFLFGIEVSTADGRRLPVSLPMMAAGRRRSLMLISAGGRRLGLMLAAACRCLPLLAAAGALLADAGARGAARGALLHPSARGALHGHPGGGRGHA